MAKRKPSSKVRKRKLKGVASEEESELSEALATLEMEILTLCKEMVSRLSRLKGLTYEQQARVYDKIALLVQQLKDLPDRVSFEKALTFSDQRKRKLHQTGEFIDWVEELKSEEVRLDGDLVGILANQYSELESACFVLYLKPTGEGQPDKFLPGFEIGHVGTWEVARTAVEAYFLRKIWERMGLIVDVGDWESEWWSERSEMS